MVNEGKDTLKQKDTEALKKKSKKFKKFSKSSFKEGKVYKKNQKVMFLKTLPPSDLNYHNL